MGWYGPIRRAPSGRERSTRARSICESPHPRLRPDETTGVTARGGGEGRGDKPRAGLPVRLHQAHVRDAGTGREPAQGECASGRRECQRPGLIRCQQPPLSATGGARDRICGKRLAARPGESFTCAAVLKAPDGPVPEHRCLDLRIGEKGGGCFRARGDGSDGNANRFTRPWSRPGVGTAYKPCPAGEGPCWRVPHPTPWARPAVTVVAARRGERRVSPAGTDHSASSAGWVLKTSMKWSGRLLGIPYFPWVCVLSPMRVDSSGVPAGGMFEGVVRTIMDAKAARTESGCSFRDRVLVNSQDATKKGEWREYREGYGSTSYGRRGF